MCEKCQQKLNDFEIEHGEVIGVRLLVILKDNEGIYDVPLHPGAEQLCKLMLAKMNSDSPLKLTKVGNLISAEQAEKMKAEGLNVIEAHVHDTGEDDDDTPHSTIH